MDALAPLLGRTLVLVAHPDDEAVGCGALLQRLREPVVVFATDGAPRDAYFWEKWGSREAYAQLRREEARSALGLAGVRHIEFLRAGEGYFTDQELFRRLAPALDSLFVLAGRHQPEALLTLAYEGGHPDHDSCSFLMSVLGRSLSLPVWEMPLYFRRKDGATLCQQFRVVNGMEVALEPSAEEQSTKHTMLAAYASQGEVLKQFSAAREWFRPQAAYDYSQPPHAGVLNYEAWGWPIKGAEVSAAFAGFLQSAQLAPGGARS
ncbi:MAG TPA: PIG-L family deacetylase [Terriglobales bacterium]|nr:PIG-L family deacetylase [Terriglobales bacterium]